MGWKIMSWYLEINWSSVISWAYKYKFGLRLHHCLPSFSSSLYFPFDSFFPFFVSMLYLSSLTSLTGIFQYFTKDLYNICRLCRGCFLKSSKASSAFAYLVRSIILNNSKIIFVHSRLCYLNKKGEAGCITIKPGTVHTTVQKRYCII